MRKRIAYAFNIYVIPAKRRAKADRLKDYAVAKDLVYAKQVSAMDSDNDDENDINFTTEENKQISLLTQFIVDNLARVLNLTGRGKEILGSRLKQNNAVTPDFRVTNHRDRKEFKPFDECFFTDLATNLTYCNKIHRLFDELGHPYNPQEWRMFIDSSKESLKVVLLHNGNKLPLVPIAYSTVTAEIYSKLKLKGGFAKSQCFICE